MPRRRPRASARRHWREAYAARYSAIRSSSDNPKRVCICQPKSGGDKVKVTLRFRGREMAHQEFGVRLLERVRGDIEGTGVVESMPRL